jgi:hypothetical protein
MVTIIPSKNEAEEKVCSIIGRSLRHRAREYVMSKIGIAAVGPFLGWTTYIVVLFGELSIASLFLGVSSLTIVGIPWMLMIVLAYFFFANCE